MDECLPACMQWVQCPQRPVKRIRSPGTRATDARELPWMSRTQHGYSAKAANAVTHWAISPDSWVHSYIYFFIMWSRSETHPFFFFLHILSFIYWDEITIFPQQRKIYLGVSVKKNLSTNAIKSQLLVPQFRTASLYVFPCAKTVLFFFSRHHLPLYPRLASHLWTSSC